MARKGRGGVRKLLSLRLRIYAARLEAPRKRRFCRASGRRRLGQPGRRVSSSVGERIVIVGTGEILGSLAWQLGVDRVIRQGRVRAVGRIERLALNLDR